MLYSLRLLAERHFATQVYVRLQEIDADQAEARAASILAGLSFTPEMQASILDLLLLMRTPDS